MKKIILFVLIIIVTLVCRAQDSFKITGQLGGTLDGNLLLVANSEQGCVELGQAVMTNGSFEFKGKVNEMMPAYVMTAERQPIAIIMLENKEFIISAGLTGIEVRGGGEAQRIWNEYDAINNLVRREQKKMEQEVKAAYSSGNQMKIKALQEQFQKVMDDFLEKQSVLFEIYKDSPVTAFMIASGMGQADYVSLKAMYDGLGEPARHCLYGQMISQQIEVFKQVEVGSVPSDFMGLTTKGDTVSLYDVKARLKLVDFWASWCQPCRTEMSNLKKIYKKYREAGLEIIGVSIDQRPADWIKALQEEGLSWLNIIDSESKIASYFLVRAIPYTVLLDGNNKIIAKDLRGKKLENKIVEILGEK